MNSPQSINLLPKDVGIIHFSGIGGIGMSGIAEILNNLGYKVQGSDQTESYMTKKLEASGIKVYIGQNAANVDNAAVIVRSSAVSDNNPEIVAARVKKIPVILRAEMLAELMKLKYCVAVAGTHGKTTTTSIVTALFAEAGMDPTVVNGGILNAYGTNAKLGKGNWLIAEADESDGTFLKLPSTIGIITNIDPEHMEHYGSFDNLKNAFKTFITNLPFYGCAVVCIDHPTVKEISSTIKDRKVITYGINSKDADIIATNINLDRNSSSYDIIIKPNLSKTVKEIKNIVLSTPGQHNVLNSLAAIAIAINLGFSEQHIKNALANFTGVKRRFTNTGTTNGITVIDDYGHHPVEIQATLKTARTVQDKAGGKVIAVVQPHRYTRVNNLFKEFSNCFESADMVVVAPIYSAGEQPIEGINHSNLANSIETSLSKPVYQINEEKDLAPLINKIASSGDMVVCLGAGTITKWANDLPKLLMIK